MIPALLPHLQTQFVTRTSAVAALIDAGRCAEKRRQDLVFDGELEAFLEAELSDPEFIRSVREMRHG